jgi:uncharacterized membrane protein
VWHERPKPFTLTDRAAVRVANWHARINIITLIVFIADFYLRTTSGAAWIATLPTLPFILSIIGVIGLTIAGWLGGQLVFAHGVAVTAEVETPVQPGSQRRHIKAA